jgi:hypothetical protein
MIISFTKLNAWTKGLVQPNIRRACDSTGGLGRDVAQSGPPRGVMMQVAMAMPRRKAGGHG